MLFVKRSGIIWAAVPVNRQAALPGQGAASCPLIFGKGGCYMVTYSELFQFCLVIIGIIGLIISVNKKK